jgi:hypothetical protein
MSEKPKLRPCQKDCFRKQRAGGVKKPVCILNIDETGSPERVSERVSHATQQARGRCPQTEINQFRDSFSHVNRTFGTPFNHAITPSHPKDPAGEYSRDKAVLRRDILARRASR